MEVGCSGCIVEFFSLLMYRLRLVLGLSLAAWQE
jgi:hypothetical protein